MNQLRIRPLDVDLIAPSTKKFREHDQGGSKIVVIGKPGCFEQGTMVRTCRGDPEEKHTWADVAIEHLDTDCLVLGDDGVTTRRVLDVCRGVGWFFTIRRADTHEHLVRVNEDHILTLYDVFHDRVVDIPLVDFLISYCSYPTVSTTHVMFKRYFFMNYASFRWIQYDPKTKTHRYIDFYVEEDGVFEQYFGIVIDGNHRFILSDGSVVHNTGKTTLITSLLYEKSHIFPTGLVMSGTEDSNGHYKKIFPSTFVYNKLDEKRIEDFIHRQKIAKRHVLNPWSVLLLDDCTDEPRILNKPVFQGLYKNGRHWKMWFILSLQYCMDIKPVIRTNIDGTFILRESNLRNRKTLWENYAGVVPDFTLFCQIMDAITDDYTALYIHNATQSNKLEDCIFWYKAKRVPHDFKFGCRDFWKFHKQRYDPQYTESFL